MKYDVFISYSHKDYIDENKQVIPNNIVSQIKQLLTDNNISYWFDEDGVYTGDAFAHMIARQIKTARIFLFISSQNSNASEWTSNEIATAYTYKKKIIPFKYDDTIYNDSVILFISRLNHIDYFANPSKSLNHLLISIKKHLKEEEEREALAQQEAEHARQLEVSRQERAAKLKELRDKIDSLENRRLDIEQDILAQEKSLQDLRNEKRFIETNIAELQDEEALLLGHSRATQSTASQTDQQESKTKRTNNLESISSRIPVKLKNDLASKHWIVNLLYGIACLSGFLFSIFLIGINIFDHYYWDAFIFCITAYCAFVGTYQIIRNRRSGITWLFLGVIPSFIHPYFGIIIIYTICLIIAMALLMMRKNGVSPWRSLQKHESKIWKDKTRIIFATIMTILCLIWGGMAIKGYKQAENYYTDNEIRVNAHLENYDYIASLANDYFYFEDPEVGVVIGEDIPNSKELRDKVDNWIEKAEILMRDLYIPYVYTERSPFVSEIEIVNLRYELTQSKDKIMAIKNKSKNKYQADKDSYEEKIKRSKINLDQKKQKKQSDLGSTTSW